MVLPLVLESIITRKEALKHPFFMLIASAMVSTVSLWVAFLSFPKSASILSIAFVTIALVPLFHAIFRHEEEQEAERPSYSALFLARHFNVVKVYAFFFIGMIFTYAFWYSVVPLETRNLMFSEQETTLAGIENLRETLTGNFTTPAGKCEAQPFCWFSVIFANNTLLVMFPAIALSLIYGAGAIFLIGWNASVLGVLIGKDIVFYAASHGGIVALIAAVNRFLGLVPHGIFESLGYFVGAIAGGIVGAALSKKRHLRGEMGTIAKDVIVMIFYAVGLLVVGALIEAWAIVSAIG